MGQLFEALLPRHVTFIEGQKIFFVGTAAAKGSVNLSPGRGFAARPRCPHLVWLSLTGSGNESAAQVPQIEHPRMTVMFCAFGAPLILDPLTDPSAVGQSGTNHWFRIFYVYCKRSERCC